MAEEKLLDLGVDSRLYNSFALEDVRHRGIRRIGELARACGVSTDTLRHYERKGVLQVGLRSSMKDWDARLAHKDPTAPAGLLEALTSSDTNSAHRLSGAGLGKRNFQRTGAKS